MAYRTDQWQNLSSTGGEGAFSSSTDAGGAGYNITTKTDNQKFIYPRRAVRTISSDGDVRTKELKRGYIRNITAPENKMGLPTTKCAFQFNPQYLVQSVSQNTTILNFLQQEPGQYAQPIPGNVTFNFDLFFDRSMELNQPTAGVPPVNPEDPWNAAPEHVGVLHDIGVFFSVIGVGLSEAMKDVARNTLERRLTAEINAQTLAQSEDSTSTVSPEEQLASKMEDADTFLKYNVGNTAFLLPLPVRIVFSSLYIVEGLVKDVTVTFTKFNAAMVPMQATLNILFEAKYIGFAKKDTFFTNVLADYEDQELAGSPFADIDIEPDLLKAYVEAIKSDLSTANIALVGNEFANRKEWFRHYMPNEWGASTHGYKEGSMLPALVSNQDLYGGGSQKIEERTDRTNLVVGFPNAVSGSRLINLIDNESRTVGVTVSAEGHLWRIQDKAFQDPNIKKLYDDVKKYPNFTFKNSMHLSPDRDSPRREALRKFYNAVRLEESSSTTRTIPAVTEPIEDQGGNTRVFSVVHKVISGHIDDTHIILENLKNKDGEDVEVNVFSSGAEELGNLFRTGLTGRVFAHEGLGYYDRSIPRETQNPDDQEDYLADKYPEYNIGVQDPNDPDFGTEDNSTFKFLIRYVLDVTVEIDGAAIGPLRVNDYVLIDEYGIADQVLLESPSHVENSYSSAMQLKLDWGSVTDDILEEVQADQAAELAAQLDGLFEGLDDFVF